VAQDHLRGIGTGMKKLLGFVLLPLIILIAVSLTSGQELHQDQAKAMCANTSDAWACRLAAQGIMFPNTTEAATGSIAELNKGLELYSQNRYDEAIQAYDMSINLNPHYLEAWNNKGIALSHLGKYSEAIQAFDVAIELNPQLADPWGNKGDSLKALLKYDEAIQAYDRAIVLDPQWAGPWIGKSLALNNQRKAAEALACAQNALELDPQNALAWYAQGDAILNLGYPDKAVQSYDKAIDLGQQGQQDILRDAWGHKGVALQRSGGIAVES
jgi:tetratricopeptide (TPR) repeat protein